MSNYKTWETAKETKAIGEINLLSSMTVPDMTMTMREIIDRFGRGLTSPGAGEKIPIYQYNEKEDPDYNFPANFEKMDISEKFESLRIVKEKINNMQKKRAEEHQEERKRRMDLMNPQKQQEQQQQQQQKIDGVN